MAFERWRLLKEKSREGGGSDRVKKHKAGGRLSARERLEAFFDADSFVELDPFVVHRSDRFGMAERSIKAERRAPVVQDEGDIARQVQRFKPCVEIPRVIDETVSLAW